jgi:hypothetical protein
LNSCLPAGFTVAGLCYQWRCEACDKIERMERMYSPLQQIEHPVTPEGWTVLDQKFYCPRHAILVLVDGKQV